jgi:AraC-like DNA-binding protein
MKENLEKRLTLNEIAQSVGYSASYFSSIFKKETGYAPLNYFNLLKIQQACFLIDTTEMTFRQICYKIGIEDVYYFSRLFRKIMGVSPRIYKKEQRG